MSELRIGKAIKRLRREKDITQEELAAAIGVTAQAVSKWEREEGYPDITLLPSIAGYFGVTVDTVCGLDAEREKEEIEKIKTQALQTLDTAEQVNIFRQGLEKYPHSYDLQAELACALLGLRDDNRQQHLEESIRLHEHILERCTDQKIRSDVQANICTAYNWAGYHDKALKMAESLPSLYKTKEIEICELVSGDVLIDNIQDGIQRWIWCLYYWVSKMCHATDHYTTDEKMALYQKVISIYETIYENRDHLFGLKRIICCYQEMAEFLLEDGRTEECIACLEKAVEFAALCEDYDLQKQPTSLLINAVDVGSGWRESYKQAKSYLHYNLTTESRYDSIRETPEFKAILEKLV